MNRKNLTAAVLAGLAGAAGIVGSAQAVNINPDGLGQVLVYPYYTTNGGNLTALSVVNTTDDAKAVKVRFMEGQNSQEVLDFNLYLSKYDVWTAAIFDLEGTPVLVVNDTTCTVPYLYMNDWDEDGERDGWQPFLPYQMKLDGGATTIDRASEGHFEMIEMGTLVDGNGIEPNMMSATAATHVNGVPPDSWIKSVSTALNPPQVERPCGQLSDAWTRPNDLDFSDDGYWLNDAYGPLTDLEAPSGGLFGGAAIVNVDSGEMYSYDATAINGFTRGLVTPGTLDPLHQRPGSLDPGLDSGDITTGTVFLQDGNTLSATFAADRGIDAVSYVFMHDQIMNEYGTSGSISGATEWVITFPTKQFYVYEDPNKPVAPFTQAWTATGGVGEACEYVKLDKIWDREEQTPTVTGGSRLPIVSPAPIIIEDGEVPFELCYEVSIIAFDGAMDDDPSIQPITAAADGGASPILGSSNFHLIKNGELGYSSGWARIKMADYPQVDGDGEIIPGAPDLVRALSDPNYENGLEGLPVTGFSVTRAGNSFLGDGGDVLANYGGLFKHKATRREGSGYRDDS